MTLPSNYALERSVTALSQRIARPRSTRTFGGPMYAFNFCLA